MGVTYCLGLPAPPPMSPGCGAVAQGSGGDDGAGAKKGEGCQHHAAPKEGLGGRAVAFLLLVFILALSLALRDGQGLTPGPCNCGNHDIVPASCGDNAVGGAYDNKGEKEDGWISILQDIAQRFYWLLLRVHHDNGRFLHGVVLS